MLSKFWSSQKKWIKALCRKLFCKELDKESGTYSIENEEAITAIKNADLVVIAYPVQFSTVPKIMRDYVTDHSELWQPLH